MSVRHCLTNYTVHCRDEISGKVGCFLFDEERWKATGKFFATGPVWADLDAFFKNTPENMRGPRYIERQVLP